MCYFENTKLSLKCRSHTGWRIRLVLANDWLTGWMTDVVTNWLTYERTDCLADWLTGWLTEGMTNQRVWLFPVVCGLSATLRVVRNLSNVGRSLKAEPCVSLLLLLTRFTFQRNTRHGSVTLALAFGLLAIAIPLPVLLALAYIERPAVIAALLSLKATHPRHKFNFFLFDVTSREEIPPFSPTCHPQNAPPSPLHSTNLPIVWLYLLLFFDSHLFVCCFLAMSSPPPRKGVPIFSPLFLVSFALSWLALLARLSPSLSRSLFPSLSLCTGCTLTLILCKVK